MSAAEKSQKVRVERARRFGDCYLGLELWKRLELDEFFAQHLDGDDADVAWSRVAAVLAINRLCAPGSELAVEQHWYPSTALDDLLHIAKGKINDARLYRCLEHVSNSPSSSSKATHQRTCGRQPRPSLVSQPDIPLGRRRHLVNSCFQISWRLWTSSQTDGSEILKTEIVVVGQCSAAIPKPYSG